MSSGSPQYPFAALSGPCAIVLLEIINDCLYCKSQDDFKKVCAKLNTLIPFDAATSGLAQLDPSNIITSYELVNISYPDKWLHTYNEKNFAAIDVIVKENFSNYSFQFWKNTYKRHIPAKQFLHLAHDFGLNEGYTFGARPFGLCKKSSPFSFSGQFKKYDPHIEAVLRIAVPHMHLAIFNILQEQESSRNRALLTAREREVLEWVKQGKSSWDISGILGISERTVNFHIYNVMNKLEVVNRAQAVAVATNLGMISVD